MRNRTALHRLLAGSFVTFVVVACGGDGGDQLGLESPDASDAFDAGTTGTGTGAEDGAVSTPDGSTPGSDGGPGDAAADANADAEPPVLATCADGIRNQDETDVDCGGATCATKCGLLGQCAGDGDCLAPTVCVAGTCAQPTSKNGVKDNGETDVDCGGPNAPPCAAAKACVQDADCADKSCVFGTCQPATAVDGLKNGTETDVDCGGAAAPKCATNKACLVGTDCLDGVCDPVKKLCTSRCNDKIKNGAETGVDCGGPSCAKCGTGLSCLTGADCASKVCTNGLCVAANCQDGVRNQTETDVDCGGTCATKCADGKRCLAGADCTSATCTGATCTPATCKNNTKDGTETDVDCGGTSCARCDTGKACTQNSDCALGRCTGGTCTNAPSCATAGNGKNTCGTNGNGDCCETIPVEGGTIANGAANEWTVSPYRLDKYEITVGRMRAFLQAKGWNLRGSPPASGAGAHKEIPGSGWNSTWNDRLPVSQANVLQRVGPGANFGCFGGPDASTWTNATSVNDQKAANCFDWYTLFAFCEWDGGYLPTEREWQWAAQGGTENRAFAFGNAPTVPKITDFLPACGNAGDPGPCQDPNTYMGAAYTSTGGALGFAGQKVDANYPAFLQPPGLYAVHGFCAFQNQRACFSYNGPNASGNAAPNASHVAPPGSKLDIGRWGHADMSGNLIEWVLDNSVNLDPATSRQRTRPACVGTNCANLDYVDYKTDNLDPQGAVILGDRSAPGNPAFWRNYKYDAPNAGGPYDLNAQYHQDGGRVMRGGSWELHSAAVGSRYGNYPVWRSYYASGARCARPW